MMAATPGKKKQAPAPQPAGPPPAAQHSAAPHLPGQSAAAAYRSAVLGGDHGSHEIGQGPAAGKKADAEPKEAPNMRRDSLVMEYLPNVKHIAYKIASRVPPHVETDDLINSGIIGLIDAAERFEPGRNVKFSTYADQRIRGEILDSLRDLDWVPRTLRRKKREIESAFQAIERETCRAATDEEVAGHLGISLDELHKSLDELKGVSLGTFADSETMNGESVIDIIPDPDADDPHLLMQESEVRSILKNAIAQLPEKEKRTVQLYYFNELNMKEIGAILNITESRVSQLHTKAMLRLRGRLRNQPISGR